MSALRVELIQTEAELAALKQPWTTMLAEAEHVSVFLTWEWIRTWWRHREHDWPLWLLVATDEEGALAGVAPLMLVEDGRRPLRVRRLVFLGDHFTTRNHQDFVARERDRTAVAAAFVDYLIVHRSAWDVLDLEGLVDSTVIRPYVEGAPGRFMARAGVQAPYLTLPATWDAYASERLSANRRQQLRRRQRQLEHDHPGQVIFQSVTQAQDLDEAMTALVALTQERWHERGLNSSFDGDCFTEFNREFAALALQNGWLRMYLLRVTGHVVAVEYSFLYRGVFSNFKKGFDLAWERYSPGMLMQAYMIQQAIAQGAREFDMLQGPHAYKYSWTDQERWDSHLALSTSLRGHAWAYSGAVFDAGLAFGRKAIPPGLRARVNTLLAPRQP